MASDRRAWTYVGDNGPAAWGSIDQSFAQCALGKMQSPIDLSVAAPGEHGDLALTYHLNALTFTNKGPTVVITAEPGGVMSYMGRQHDFSELHFHAPAEHTIGTDHPHLEGHFVHIGPNRSIAVVAVLFNAVSGDQQVDHLVATVPEPGESASDVRLVDIQRFIPLGSKRYRYRGSLTTPPCSEGVEWIVMHDRQPVGADALAAFTQRFAPNNRPLQPLNERTVTLG